MISAGEGKGCATDYIEAKKKKCEPTNLKLEENDCMWSKHALCSSNVWVGGIINHNALDYYRHHL